MSLTWSAVCIKYLLFIFNLLFVITGIIIISLGVSIKTYFQEYEFFLDDKYFSTANFLIAIGAIIFFIAFFGCCGAIKENFCMILTFSTFLILIFVLEFAAGISGYVLKSNTQEYLSGRLNDSLHHYMDNNQTKALWDTIQRDFSCCGVKSDTDWVNVTNGLPMSCCGNQIGAIGTATCNVTTPELHHKGCLDAFGQFVRDHVYTIGSAGFALAFVQLLGIFFSCHLSRQIKVLYETV